MISPFPTEGRGELHMEFVPVKLDEGTVRVSRIGGAQTNFGEVCLALQANDKTSRQQLRDFVITEASKLARTSTGTPPRIAGSVVIVTVELDGIDDSKRHGVLAFFARDLLANLGTTSELNRKLRGELVNASVSPSDKPRYVRQGGGHRAKRHKR